MTRRRGSGEDSIYRDGDRWRGAVSLGYDEQGDRLRKKVSGRTRAEVTEKLRKLHQQVDSGVVPDDRLTLQTFLDRWLTTCPAPWPSRQRTITWTRCACTSSRHWAVSDWPS